MSAFAPPTGPRAFPTHIPFVEALGMELWSAADGATELRLKLDPEHMNSREMAHGGVVMALLDVAMAQAARTLHRAGEAAGPGVTTIEMKTSFLRPSAGTLYAKGQVLHRTASMAFCEATVRDDTGAACAHATGTFKYMRPVPLPGAHVAATATNTTNESTP